MCAVCFVFVGVFQRRGADVLFFFNDTATTEIYTLSLHDALPISSVRRPAPVAGRRRGAAPIRERHRHGGRAGHRLRAGPDRKSTRLNSSHANISYAVFCLKKKKTKPHSLLQHELINYPLLYPCSA